MTKLVLSNTQRHVVSTRDANVPSSNVMQNNIAKHSTAQCSTSFQFLGSQRSSFLGYANRSVAASARLCVPRMASTMDLVGLSKQMMYGTSPVSDRKYRQGCSSCSSVRAADHADALLCQGQAFSHSVKHIAKDMQLIACAMSLHVH